jgi:hypothetical protein
MKKWIVLCILGIACTKELVKPKVNNDVGVTFYVFKYGDIGYVPYEAHGLMYKEVDGLYQWGCTGIDPHLMSNKMTYGANNTHIIDSICGNNGMVSLCTNGWYIPNFVEADHLFEYFSKNNLPKDTTMMWMSILFDPYNAHIIRMSDGATSADYVKYKHHVKLVKRF